MGLFPDSFKFQMDSLYISWQLSHSRRKKKQVSDKESVQLEEEKWSAEWWGQNGKHFLFFLLLFLPSLFPLTPGLNPELLKKPSRFSSPFPGVVWNNAGSVTVTNLWIQYIDSLTAGPRSANHTKPMTKRDKEREREGAITTQSYVILFSLQRHCKSFTKEM